MFGTAYEVDGYLSPLFSPLIAPAWLPWFISPGLLILWIPLGFRATCYYYRKAYYRFYFADPPGCAVGEPTVHGRYAMETKLPFLLQNFHRYFLYLAFDPAVLPVGRCRAVAVPGGQSSARPRERHLLRQRRAPVGLLAVVQLAAPPGRRPARLLLVHPKPARPVHACGSGSPVSISITCAGHGSASSRSSWPTSTSECSPSASSPTRRSTSRPPG